MKQPPITETSCTITPSKHWGFNVTWPASKNQVYCRWVPTRRKAEELKQKLIDNGEA